MELAELIKRVEGLTGANSTLDVAILRRIAGRPNANVVYAPVTASVDAVIQLIAEKMPGWGWQVGPFSIDGISRAQLAEPVETEYGPGIGVRAQASAPTPSLALLLAFLRAWEERDEKG